MRLRNDECRKWRNAFYGLPESYKPAPENEGGKGYDAYGCRTTNVDVKCLISAADKCRRVYA
jgi:hypothetical protein